MPFVDNLLQGAAVVARQAASTTVASVTSAAAGTTPAAINPSSTDGVLSTPFASSFFPSSTASAPATTTTPAGNNGSSGGGGSSPLLFFVALGFGVVFTNLWIIVGVKYCFRYNARARQMRLAAEDGEPINLENMPRPHRRRREKKLMTIDEVNEKFPMMKYKSWVASRAEEGLPTLGGVDAPSRANSVRSVEGVTTIPDLQPKERESTDEAVDRKEAASTTVTSTPEDATASAAAGTSTVDSSATTPRKSTSGDRRKSSDTDKAAAVDVTEGSLNKDSLTRNSDDRYHHDDDDDDDEHIIDAALPPELVGTSGDTCAICIDTLEDDDDVRGLTCGHAFHAVCLDPWLTSRRACCPLCKADYYTPKPRAPPAEGDASGTAGLAGASMSGNGDMRHRMNMPTRPHGAWINIRAPGRMFGINGTAQDAPPAPPPGAVDGPGAGGPAIPPQEISPPSNRGLLSRIRGTSVAPQQQQQHPSAEAYSGPRNWMAGMRFPGLRPANNNGGSQEVTPSQLESGTRQ